MSEDDFVQNLDVSNNILNEFIKEVFAYIFTLKNNLIKMNLYKNIKELQLQLQKNTKLKKTILSDFEDNYINIYHPTLKQRDFIFKLIELVNKGKLSNEELEVRLLSMLTDINFNVSNFDKIIENLNDPNELLIEVKNEIYDILEEICIENNKLEWEKFCKIK